MFCGYSHGGYVECGVACGWMRRSRCSPLQTTAGPATLISDRLLILRRMDGRPLENKCSCYPDRAWLMSELTQLFDAVNSGDRGAVDRLMAVMYQELRQLAHRRLNASPRGNTLETTGLVHESYLRFLNAGRLRINDRTHFMAYASRVMRSIIIDLARSRGAERHGGGMLQVTLNTQVADEACTSDEHLIRINEVLEELSKSEPRLVQVVEMRYFGGLNESEIAEMLGLTERTVQRDWKKARLLLSAALG
jgi:RNA polymerase sigma factor (TIGR02999 family)